MDLIINSDCPSIPLRTIPLNTQGSVALNLLESLGYDPAHPPLAELLRISHDLLPGRWLLLSPVYWQASAHDVLLLRAGEHLQWSEKEARYWFDLLASHVAFEGMSLYFHRPDLWLLCAEKKPPLNARPPQQLLQVPLRSELMALDSTSDWQKFLTECQMLFAADPKESLVNGLWVWGDGPLKEKSGVACVEEAFLTLAQACFSSVEIYHPSLTLKNYQTLIIEDLQTLSPKHQRALPSLATRWYWNNAAYACRHNVLTRFWRVFTHAD